MATFLLIRHGENDWVGNRLAGHTTGVHLNQNGLAQAEHLAATLSKLPINAIYSSPLERAIETAQPLAARMQIPIQTDYGVSEVHFGTWEGKTFEELRSMESYKISQQTPSKMQFPDGESFAGAQQRLLNAIQKINQDHKKEDLIAIFSHGDSIRLLIAYFLGMALDDFRRIKIDLASISMVSFYYPFPVISHVNLIPEIAWTTLSPTG